MRKIIVLTFLSLDGVMQSPGAPQEDSSNGFKLGGWTVPYFDEALGKEMGRQMEKPSDLLLGRKTYEIFRSYWPTHVEDWPAINTVTKYVASTTMTASDWEPTVFLGNDIPAAIKALKDTDGPDLQVQGSATLIHTLMEHDLVDEYWFKFFPVMLGQGKRLFTDSLVPGAFELIHSEVTPSGVLIASYKRAGDVKIGSFPR